MLPHDSIYVFLHAKPPKKEELEYRRSRGIHSVLTWGLYIDSFPFKFASIAWLPPHRYMRWQKAWSDHCVVAYIWFRTGAYIFLFFSLYVCLHGILFPFLTYTYNGPKHEKSIETEKRGKRYPRIYQRRVCFIEQSKYFWISSWILKDSSVGY